MDGSKKILLVEDDPNFGAVLKDYLILNNYQVTHAIDGEEGEMMFKSSNYDLCILDVMMPRKDGFSLATEIREINKEIPIIFLSAKTMKEDVLRGYQVGADDYLYKPFDSQVLLLKINAIFHRIKLEKEKVEVYEQIEFTIGNFSFNSKLRQLSIKGEVVEKLTIKESKLFTMLLTNKNEVISREFALTKIWRDDNYFTSRSMDVYIAKLRKYLKADKNVQIINLHGEGFRLIEK